MSQQTLKPKSKAWEAIYGEIDIIGMLKGPPQEKERYVQDQHIGKETPQETPKPEEAPGDRHSLFSDLRKLCFKFQESANFENWPLADLRLNQLVKKYYWYKVRAGGFS